MSKLRKFLQSLRDVRYIASANDGNRRERRKASRIVKRMGAAR